MRILSGGDVVLPDRVLSPGSVTIDDDRIVDVQPGRAGGSDATVVQLDGFVVAPGFVDTHVHGVMNHDVLAGPESLREVARLLPRFGVVAFCPTSMACGPAPLRALLDGVAKARREPVDGARVLPAHLESNFLAPEFRGAQPARCLRLPPRSTDAAARASDDPAAFPAHEILDAIDAGVDRIAILTLAPELPGALELVGWLVERGIRVSMGHSAATLDEALAAIEAGATRATHLFNRMPPLHHRAPGLAGAALLDARVFAEVIADGFHLHPSTLRLVTSAKGLDRTVAVTDGTAASGLPVGSRTRLGDQPITAGERSAVLDDGTVAGSSATMDAVFRMLVRTVGLGLAEAARLCATTPARSVGIDAAGAIEPGAPADLVVLDDDLRVASTLIGGQVVGTWLPGAPSI